MPQEKCDGPLWVLVVEFNSLGLDGKYFYLSNHPHGSDF